MVVTATGNAFYVRASSYLSLIFSSIHKLDIQGSDWKKPRFRTHAKMRWDDKYLYVGAFLQETDVWANQTKHDSVGKCLSYHTIYVRN